MFFPLSFPKFLPISWFLALFAVFLAACGRPHEPGVEDGVRFIINSRELLPTSTFELRFDDAVVAAGDVGLPARESPLIVTPPLAGKFVWLSQHSGVFTPAEPTVLGTAYRFTLRRGLQRADHQPLSARLDRTLDTPQFAMTAFCPRHFNRTNAPSRVEMQLSFNADVSAAGIAPFLEFRDGRGQSVQAVVRQAAADDYMSFYEWDGVFEGTWKQRFPAARSRPASSPGRHERRGNEEIVAPKPNCIVVKPMSPLPVGENWRLVLAKGLPSTETPLRLGTSVEIPIGTVQPFVVRGALSDNVIGAGKTVSIEFSKDIAPVVTCSNFANWVTVVPTPADLDAVVHGNRLELSGSFLLTNNYAVSVKAGFPADGSFALAATWQTNVSFEAIPPRLYFPAFTTDQLSVGRRQFDLIAVNAPFVHVRAKLLDAGTLIHALRVYRSYFKHANDPDYELEPYSKVDFNVIPGRTVFTNTFHIDKPIDVAERLKLNWSDVLRDRKQGAVFIAAELDTDASGAPRQIGSQALVQITDLGFLWKREQGALCVYVFSYATGKPVPGASVRLLTDENETLKEQVTDAGGVATLPQPEKARWIMVQHKDDLHALELDDSDTDIRLWRFRIPLAEEFGDETSKRSLLLFSDRPVYRPGESLLLKAIARDWIDGRLSVPKPGPARVQVLDARDQCFYETNLTFSTLGSVDVAVPLPAGPLGGYRVELTSGECSATHPFRVEDYQPNAFELVVGAKPSYAAGDTLQVPVTAKYFMGKPLSRAKLSWSIDASDAGFEPKGFDDFVFCAHGDEADRDRMPGAVSSQGEGRLSAKGEFLIKPELAANRAAPQPRRVELHVEITDLNQQTISETVEFTRHSSDFYLGLKQLSTVARAGEKLPVALIAVRPDGTPLPDSVVAHVALQRIEWQTVRVKAAGGAISYRSEPKFIPVAERDVKTLALHRMGVQWELDADAVSAELLPPEAGSYLVCATARDANGCEIVTTTTVNVTGPEKLAWDYRNAVQMSLVPDQTRYEPGQTAVILAKTPISGNALVTVERDKVLRSFVTTLSGNAPVISVPIVAGDAPNVFVSVTLIRGAADCPREAKMPEFRVGYCQLNVENPASKLRVTVTPDASDYRPGKTVTVTAEVHNAAAQPVTDAEVTLYAVDEGILSLMGYERPDPYAFFNATQPLRVRSSISLSNLFGEDDTTWNFGNKGYLIGGGGMEGTLRKNFLPVAFWNATLRTDAGGKLRASFTAPDSLTRYRVIAVAHTVRSELGAGEASFRINKPLMIEPALPRFACIGDQIAARAVVHNSTDLPADVNVTLALDDKAKAGSTTRNLKLAARGSVAVEFPVKFVEPGETRWIWRVRADGPDKFTDAVESRLAIGHVAPLLREVYDSRSDAAETDLLKRVNPQLIEGKGTVTVRVSNSRLGGLGEAVQHLLHYPYGCVEQTTSSMLPWLALGDVANAVPALKKPPAQVRAAVERGIERLWKMQTDSGGLAYWPGQREPMLWASAYGGLGLMLAKRAEFRVPAASLNKLLNYLSAQLRNSASFNDDCSLSDRCLALYTLALAGRAEASYHEVLYGKRDRLSAESRAVLALAIFESAGSPQMIHELLQPAAKPAPPREAPFGCDARDIAVRLLAFCRCRPQEPAVDTLLEELLHSAHGGHWGTTQGNAWAMLALSEYAQRTEKHMPAASGTLAWGGESHPFQLDGTVMSFEKTFAITPKIARTPLRLLNPAGARLFTQLRVEARVAVAKQPRQDRGFLVQRSYERIAEDGTVQELKQPRVGDSVLVTLQLETREPAHFVVVDDPLPGVFEAVNPEFKSQKTPDAALASENWYSDFRELRADRALFFRDHLAPGRHKICYLARVRAAGTATAPAARVEMMYQPERFGLSETATVTCLPME